MRRIVLLVTLIGLLADASSVARDNRVRQEDASYIVAPGDTWKALSLRTGTPEAELRQAYGHFNQSREPAIGSTLPLTFGEQPSVTGRLERGAYGGLLEVAVRANRSPWQLALDNHLPSPSSPTLYRALLIADTESVPREVPLGFADMAISYAPLRAGEPFAVSGTLIDSPPDITADIDGIPLAFSVKGERTVGVGGTGAFFSNLEPELSVTPPDQPAWRQPVQFITREWDYQNLTLSGEAAQIDQAARDAERARLREIWTKVSPEPLWTKEFDLPIDNYLELTAGYGGRRSYNGGPYLSYHEGVDFSAYAGTPVYAPATGVVVLAEPLYVRGGTVIIDHGLGVYTGYYHLSEIHAQPGQTVQPGDLIGGVGTTGLSTGNHLHWDLLTNGTWVDAISWRDRGLACWIRHALALSCDGEGE